MSNTYIYDSFVDFSILVGKTLVAIIGAEKDSEEVTFICSDGSKFQMEHWQDCCESVILDDIVGDLQNILLSPILIAEERTNNEEPPPDFRYTDSYTWTFYELATIKGSVTLRWFGESNGYYSESVHFFSLD